MIAFLIVLVVLIVFLFSASVIGIAILGSPTTEIISYEYSDHSDHIELICSKCGHTGHVEIVERIDNKD